MWGEGLSKWAEAENGKENKPRVQEFMAAWDAFLFKKKKKIHFLLCSVFVAAHGISLVAMSRWGAALLLRSPRLSGTRAQELWSTGSAAPRQVGSSWTRGRTRVSCIARWIQKHWTTREAPCFPLKTSKQNKTSSNSKESGDLSGIRTEPRVRPGRQGIEEVPNNSGIKRNDFQAILLKTTKKIKINAEIFHDEQNIPV